MARQWERVDEDTVVGPQVWTGSASKFFSANTGVHISTMETRSSALAGDLIVAEEPTGGMAFETALKGESRIAAVVVMDDALVQDDGIDSIVEELDRCWEVTQDQDKASNIEKGLFETQRDVKMERTFMSEEAQFSTVGKCTGDATTSGDQGLHDSARRETC